MLEGNAMFESLQDLERVLMPKKKKTMLKLTHGAVHVYPRAAFEY